MDTLPDQDKPEEEKKGPQHQLSSGSVLGKRKATHLPMREDASKAKQIPPSQAKPVAATTTNVESLPASVQPQKQLLKLNDSYQQQQEEHLKTVERERKYQQTKKLREQ